MGRFLMLCYDNAMGRFLDVVRYGIFGDVMAMIQAIVGGPFGVRDVT